MKRIPKKHLQRVYDLAVEMSYSDSYSEHDDNCDIIGRDRDIIESLNIVRRTFKLKGEVEH